MCMMVYEGWNLMVWVWENCSGSESFPAVLLHATETHVCFSVRCWIPGLSTRAQRSLKGNWSSSGSILILVYFCHYFSSYPKITLFFFFSQVKMKFLNERRWKKVISVFKVKYTQTCEALLPTDTKLSGSLMNLTLEFSCFEMDWFKIKLILMFPFFSRSLQGRFQGSPHGNLHKALCGLLEYSLKFITQPFIK